MRNIVKSLFGARIQIALAHDAMALVYRGPGPRAKATLLADVKLETGLAHEPQRLSKLCADALSDAKHRRLPLHVILDDSWVRLFLVTPPQNVGRLQDLQAAAAMRFQALFGDAPGGWQIEADWQTSGAFLACALPRVLASGLQQLAIDHGLYLHAIQPQFVATWNRHRKTMRDHDWFGVVCGNHLTLGVLATSSSGKSGIQSVRSISIPSDGHALPWLQEQVSRIALQMNVTPPHRVCLTGNQRQHWAGNAANGGITVQNLDNTKRADGVIASISSANLMAQGALGL